MAKVQTENPLVHCGECWFFESLKDDYGLCRRYAPRSVTPATVKQHDYINNSVSFPEPLWPRVNEVDGCGDGAAMPETEIK